MKYYKTFHDKYIDKECKLLIVADKSNYTMLNDILIRFINLNHNKIISFDLEFSQKGGRKIAIMQLALHFDNEIIILFINPLTLPNDINDKIKTILTDLNIIKIGHGTDSLDIPELFKFLENDEKRILFIRKLYDTRFLCEYIKALTDDKLCNIYKSMEDFNVVDREQIDFLTNNEKKLGSQWWYDLKITKLTPEIIDYAMYDALYLKKLLKNLKIETEKQKLDYKLLLDVGRYSILVQQNIIDSIGGNEFNTYRIHNYSFSDVYDTVYVLFNDEIPISYKKIFAFGYFKNKLLPLSRLCFYKMLDDNNNKIITQYNLMIKSLHLFPSIISMLHDLSNIMLSKMFDVLSQ